MEKLKLFLPVVAWCLVIFLLSSMPSYSTAPDTIQNFLLKKFAHLAEYAILYWLTYYAINKNRVHKNWFGPLIFIVLYAISDEIHQSFVPGRRARWYDVGIDTIGALISREIIRRISRKKN